MKTCAVAGHHPTRFKFKYKENNTGCKRLKKRIKEQFTVLYEKGVRVFLIGGTLGADIWAGELLLQLQAEPKYSDIRLITVIPFNGHDRDWDERNRKRLAFLKAHSEVMVASGVSGAVSYQKRDKYMLDHANHLLAIYDNDRTVKNNIGQTVDLAIKRGISVIYIHPDNAKVSYSK